MVNTDGQSESLDSLRGGILFKYDPLDDKWQNVKKGKV